MHDKVVKIIPYEPSKISGISSLNPKQKQVFQKNNDERSLRCSKASKDLVTKLSNSKSRNQHLVSGDKNIGGNESDSILRQNSPQDKVNSIVAHPPSDTNLLLKGQYGIKKGKLSPINAKLAYFKNRNDALIYVLSLYKEFVGRHNALRIKSGGNNPNEDTCNIMGGEPTNNLGALEESTVESMKNTIGDKEKEIEEIKSTTHKMSLKIKKLRSRNKCLRKRASNLKHAVNKERSAKEILEEWKAKSGGTLVGLISYVLCTIGKLKGGTNQLDNTTENDVLKKCFGDDPILFFELKRNMYLQKQFISQCKVILRLEENNLKLDQMNRCLQHEYDSLKYRFTELEHNLSDTEIKLRLTRKQDEQYQILFYAKDQENQDSRKMIADLEDKLRQENNENLKQEIQENNEKLEEMIKENALLQEKAREADGLSDLSSQNAQLKIKITELEKHLGNAQALCKAYGKCNKDKEDYFQQVNILSAKLDESKRARHKQQEESQKEIEHLTSQIVTQQKIIEGIQQALAT